LKIGEIVQRKNTDMQTEPQINIPKRKQLTDTGSNEIFNKPSETNDYKSILNTSNKEMAKIIKRVEKLSTKKPKETKPIETQTEPQNIKSFSSIATETQNIIKHGGTQTEILKPKKLIFNPKNIEKRKQILKYKDYVPGNLLTVQGKQKKITPEINKKLDSYLVPQTISEKVQKKDELKKKAHSILAGVQTNIPAFKYLPPPQKSSLTIVKKKQPLKMNEKSLVNITDINVSKSKDALKHFTKINNMFKDATKSDKNMNDILQGLQMQNKIPDFLKKDTGGILETPQKQEKASNKIKSFIKDSLERKKENKKQEIASVKPVELFGGTRSGTIIHPEATAPPQPLYGKPIEKSIHDNFEKIRKIYDTPPKSYKEVLDAKVEINKYKQQINRIKIRNAKSVLSSEQIAFKKETLIEIKKLQKTYDKIYKDFYKDQQPKKGRPKKSKA
jgi:hypothetical protein